MSHCTYNRGHCKVCGRGISNAGLAVTSHGKAHLRRGEVVAAQQLSWKGVVLRSRVVTLVEMATLEAAQDGWRRMTVDEALALPYHQRLDYYRVVL